MRRCGQRHSPHSIAAEEQGGAVSLGSRLVDRLLQLPPPETRDVAIRRNVRVPMADGVDLLADHYVPALPGPRPLVLIRSPYGRKGFIGTLLARPFAERGFQVLLQSCRGTFGSGGKFNPHHDERRDGLATLDWIAAQAWNPGAVATYGLSYLGYVQWAMA